MLPVEDATVNLLVPLAFSIVNVLLSAVKVRSSLKCPSPFEVRVPAIFTVLSKTAAPVTPNVPGKSTLSVHSTLVPSAAVCNTCLAAPSANLLTAISVSYTHLTLPTTPYV